MSQKTNIQLSHSACVTARISSSEHVARRVKTEVRRIIGHRDTGEIYRDRKHIATVLKKKLRLTKGQREMIVDVIRRLSKCYAGLLGTNRAGHNGYAVEFDQPKFFPGRMAAAAKWGSPSESEMIEKPWLAGVRRMTFVSDMGDSLSADVSFEYLREEIIDIVSSALGRRHLWLWLTKRPVRMAKFAQWLNTRGVNWPDNLVAMTTVTSQATMSRVDALRKVPARFRGLSIEPLYSKVQLDLTGIHWVIVGGGSDTLAEPFQVEWAEDIREQCNAAGVAFFLKQLGKNPVYLGKSLNLKHRHGGDWSEWPAHLRIREIPPEFRQDNPSTIRSELR